MKNIIGGMKMNQKILERSIESKYTPEAVKKNAKQEMYSSPKDLGRKLAKESLKKLKLN